MIYKRKSQRLMMIIVLSTIVAAVIVAVTSVRYMQERFRDYDEAIFERLTEASKEVNVTDFFEHIEEHINDRDIVVAVNFEGTVVESEGLVVGEQFERFINSKVKSDDNRIVLDRRQFELNTYIQDVDVRLDDVYTLRMEDDIRVYYIPFRLMSEHDYLHNVLRAISVACLTTAFAIALINKDISEMMNDEKRNLEFNQGDR